jgi:MFS family permease
MQLLNTLVPEDFREVVTKPLKRFYLCTVLSCIGFGLTLSLFVVYVHNVRHFSEGFATLLLAGAAIVSLASGPILGTLVDRFGPVAVIVPSMMLEAAAQVFWAVARREIDIVAAGLLITLFGGGGWGPATTLMSRLVPEEHRQRAFGINFLLVNLGIGFGGLISASIVDLHHPFTFTVLYVLNAGVCLCIAALYLTLRTFGKAVTLEHEDPATRDEGWREVLHDRRLMYFIAASLVMMIGGYGSMEAGFSLFVVNNLHLSVHVIGVILFFNTSTIVGAQLFILNHIQGRSRARVMAVAGVLWTAFWIILFFSLHFPAVIAVISICVGISIFAVGETMMSPIGPALVNELAPEHLRGRYNATQGLTYGLAGTVAPMITAFFFSVHWGDEWPLFVGGASLCGSFLMLRLRHRLSAREDGTELVDDRA